VCSDSREAAAKIPRKIILRAEVLVDFAAGPISELCHSRPALGRTFKVFSSPRNYIKIRKISANLSVAFDKTRALREINCCAAAMENCFLHRRIFPAPLEEKVVRDGIFIGALLVFSGSFYQIPHY
jgi:hypothetical protein